MASFAKTKGVIGVPLCTLLRSEALETVRSTRFGLAYNWERFFKNPVQQPLNRHVLKLTMTDSVFEAVSRDGSLVPFPLPEAGQIRSWPRGPPVSCFRAHNQGITRA